MSPDEALSVALASDGQACNIFSVEELSAPGTLKKAFRRLALLLHPDKNSHPDAAQGFQKLQAAFEAALAGNHGTKSKPQATPQAAPQRTSSAPKPQPKAQPAPQRTPAQDGAGRYHHAPPPPHSGAPPPPKPPKPPATSAKADFFDDDFPLPPDVFDMPLPKRSGTASKKKAGGPPPPPPPPMPSSASRGATAAGPPPPPPPRADAGSSADPPRRSQPYGGVPQHATENVSGADRAWEEAAFFSDRPASTAYSWKPDPAPADTPPTDRAEPGPAASPRVPPPPPKRTVQLESLQSIFSRLDMGMDDDEDIDVALRRATGEKAQPTVSSSYSAPRPSVSSSGARSAPTGLGAASGGTGVIKVYCRACGQSNNVPASGHGVAVCRGCHAQFSVAAAIADPGKPKKKNSAKTGGDRCACGAARKGQCFMCSS